MRWLWLLFAALLPACSDGTASSGEAPVLPVACAAGELPLGDGCCPAGSWGLPDGSCEPAGVPPADCGDGFEPDAAGGCSPILPANACPPGQMAVPGERACAELAPCGEAPWGDIPTEPSTQHVDGAYAGGDSDGTALRPFTTIQGAVDAAADGAIVAIAAGSYVETVFALSKPVRLWGRCPTMVELAPAAGASGALYLESSNGSEVHSLSLTGGAADGGILISGATDLLIDRVWIHDMPGRSINVQTTLGETSVTLRRSLVESGDTHGMFLAGGSITIEESVVRGTLAGEGIVVRTYMGDPAKVQIVGSLVENNQITGVRLSSSELLVERSVIRDTWLPPGAGTSAAIGIMAFEEIGSGGAPGPPTSLTVRSTVLSRHIGSAIFAGGVATVIEHVTLRDMLPLLDDVGAAALVSSPFSSESSTASPVAHLELRASLVEGAQGIGVWTATDALIERLLVRSTRAEVGTSVGALGLAMGFTEPVTIALSGSRVEASEGGGIALDAVTGTMEGTLVLATAPGPTGRGEGLLIQRGSMSGAPSDVRVRGCRIDQSYRTGVAVLSSHAALEGTLVAGTLPSIVDDRYGDGLTVQTRSEIAASLELSGCRFENNARAGVSSFGAEVELFDSLFECNGIDLNGERSPSEPPVDATFVDAGGNLCGCDAEHATCGVQSSGLEAPEPPEPPTIEP